MSLLFFGGEMDAFVANSSGVTEVTSTTFDSYNTGFSRTAIELTDATEYIEGAIASGQTSPYAHFDVSAGIVSIGSKFFSWLDASGTEKVRLSYNGTTTLTLEYYNGSAWVSAGTTTANLKASRQTIDIAAVVNSASGSLKLYIAGTELIDSGTIDLSGTTSLKNFRFYGMTSGPSTNNIYVSQVIVADEPTIGMRLGSYHPSGAGATSSWTGDYSSIDETVYSDADFILSATANQVSTFAQTGPALTGYVVRAVGVSTRSKCGVGGPQNLRHALRSASTNYFSSADIALDVGYESQLTIWETDPATSAAWVNTAISTLQPGVKSIA